LGRRLPVLEIELKHFGPNYSSLCTTYYNIGCLHEKQNDYTEALHVFEKGHGLAQETLPSQDPLIFEYEAHIATTRKHLSTKIEEATDKTTSQ